MRKNFGKKTWLYPMPVLILTLNTLLTDRELPLALECRLVRFNEDGICIGDIVNVSVDESVLGADGVPDTDRLDAIVFDGIRNLYRHVGKAAAPAFEAGKKLI